MDSELEDSLVELTDVMSSVSSSYAIWRELTDADNRLMYEDIKEEFRDFFSTIDHANLAVVVTGLSIFFEENGNTHNLKTVLLKKTKQGRLYERRVDGWLSEIESWAPMLKKIMILRSNVFAHRGGKNSAPGFFQRAQITPNEIGELVSKAEALLAEVARAIAWDKVVLPQTREAKESTQALKRALRNA